MSRIKNFFVGAYYFITSRYVLKHILFMLGSLVLMLFVLFWILGWYTGHGSSVEVPDLVYQRVNQIDALVKVKGLRYTVADSVYHSDKEPGIILEQYPKAKSHVKEGRQIYIIVNRWSPPNVNLYYKDLIGRPLNHIQRKLKSLDLRIGKVTYHPGPAANTAFRIMMGNRLIFKEADPAKGEKRPIEPYPVPKGAVIDLQLYEEIDADPRKVPMLPCMQFADAENAIINSGFNVGSIQIEGELKDTLKGYVWKQSPLPYSVEGMGASINVWLTADVVPCDDNEPTTPPSKTGDDGWND